MSRQVEMQGPPEVRRRGDGVFVETPCQSSRRGTTCRAPGPRPSGLRAWLDDARRSHPRRRCHRRRLRSFVNRSDVDEEDVVIARGWRPSADSSEKVLVVLGPKRTRVLCQPRRMPSPVSVARAMAVASSSAMPGCTCSAMRCTASRVLARTSINCSTENILPGAFQRGARGSCHPTAGSITAMGMSRSAEFDPGEERRQHMTGGVAVHDG